MPGNIRMLQNRVDSVEVWMKALQTSVLKFMDMQQKLWVEQQKFNRNQEITNQTFREQFSQYRNVFSPYKQVKLDKFIREAEDRDKLYG